MMTNRIRKYLIDNLENDYWSKFSIPAFIVVSCFIGITQVMLLGYKAYGEQGMWIAGCSIFSVILWAFIVFIVFCLTYIIIFDTIYLTKRFIFRKELLKRRRQERDFLLAVEKVILEMSEDQRKRFYKMIDEGIEYNDAWSVAVRGKCTFEDTIECLFTCYQCDGHFTIDEMVGPGYTDNEKVWLCRDCALEVLKDGDNKCPIDGAPMLVVSCDDCRGTGEEDTPYSSPCPRCGGSGKLHICSKTDHLPFEEREFKKGRLAWIKYKINCWLNEKFYWLFPPIDTCNGCKKLSRVLWFYVGKHNHPVLDDDLPF